MLNKILVVALIVTISGCTVKGRELTDPGIFRKAEKLCADHSGLLNGRWDPLTSDEVDGPIKIVVRCNDGYRASTQIDIAEVSAEELNE